MEDTDMGEGNNHYNSGASYSTCGIDIPDEEITGKFYAFSNGSTISIADSVSEMEQQEYVIGDVIRTSGYYAPGDGGAANYIISDEPTMNSLPLPDGNYANIEITGSIINVKQLGAYGDGVHDDSEALNKAFAAGYDNVLIPEGEYRCLEALRIKNSNVNIIGVPKKSIIFTDNEYREYSDETQSEHFLLLWQVTGVSISNITIEARETKSVGYYRQASIIYSSNISISNCEFNVPATVRKDDSNTDRQYSNLTLYSGWRDISVTGCRFTQLSGVERGSCIGILDIWNAGCDGAKITGNVMYHNSHDEMIGLFSGTKDSTSIKNVNISYNEIHALTGGDVTDRVMCVTLGYDNSKNINNVVFENNNFYAEVKSNIITTGNLAGCIIRNNNFDIVHTSDITKGFVIKCSTGAKVYDNTITVRSLYDNSGLSGIAYGCCDFVNNRVSIFCRVNIITGEEVETQGNVWDE